MRTRPTFNRCRLKIQGLPSSGGTRSLDIWDCIQIRYYYLVVVHVLRGKSILAHFSRDLRGTSRASFLALSEPLTEPKCPPPTCRLGWWRGHDLLRRHHRRNGGRRPPGWAARADAVPTRRSELLSSPSQKGDTADPMRRARPNQSRKRSRTRFLCKGFANFDIGVPHFCISPSWPRTSSR